MKSCPKKNVHKVTWMTGFPTWNHLATQRTCTTVPPKAGQQHSKSDSAHEFVFLITSLSAGQINHSRFQSVKSGPCGDPKPSLQVHIALLQSELNPKINKSVSRQKKKKGLHSLQAILHKNCFLCQGFLSAVRSHEFEVILSWQGPAEPKEQDFASQNSSESVPPVTRLQKSVEQRI